MSAYVKRTIFRACENGTRISTCHHWPRCGPLRPGQRLGEEPFGRYVTSWTGPIRSPRQAEREAAAWQSTGWATEIVESTPEVRAEVRAWQRKAKAS